MRVFNVLSSGLLVMQLSGPNAHAGSWTDFARRILGHAPPAATCDNSLGTDYTVVTEVDHNRVLNEFEGSNILTVEVSINLGSREAQAQEARNAEIKKEIELRGLKGNISNVQRAVVSKSKVYIFKLRTREQRDSLLTMIAENSPNMSVFSTSHSGSF